MDPDTGKQVRETKTALKLTEARSLLRKHEADLDRGAVVIPRELTLAQWLTTWMETVIKLNRAPTTVYAYQNVIDKYIVPALGGIALQKVTPQQLQRHYAERMTEDELSANTVLKPHDLLNAAF